MYLFIFFQPVGVNHPADEMKEVIRSRDQDKSVIHTCVDDSGLFLKEKTFFKKIDGRLGNYSSGIEEVLTYLYCDSFIVLAALSLNPGTTNNLSAFPNKNVEFIFSGKVSVWV